VIAITVGEMVLRQVPHRGSSVHRKRSVGIALSTFHAHYAMRLCDHSSDGGVAL
jgi:hypothetical protein